jgi:hypothetical protein
MDVLFLSLVIGFLIVLALFFVMRSSPKVPEETSAAFEYEELPTEEPEKVIDIVTKAKPATKKAKPKLPSDSKLQALTKVALADLAKEEYGVELSKSKTKADMIAELRKAVK